MRRCRGFLARTAAAAMGMFLLAGPVLAQDALPSWNDTASKKAIARLRRARHEERLARLRAARRAHRHLRQRRHAVGRAADLLPALLRPRPRQGARAAASGMEGQGALRLAAQGRRQGGARRRRASACSRSSMATHAGMTTDEFETIVKDWIATAKHPATRPALHRDGLPADARAARPICAPTASRPSSSPAAASSSCAPWPRRSTASRPSRSSGSPA